MNTYTDEKNKLQALLDISIGLYEAKTFGEIGETIALNLQNFRHGAPIGGVKLCVYDSELDQYCLYYDRSVKHQSEYVRQIASPLNKQFSLREIKYYSKIALEQNKTLIIQDNHSEFSLSIDERQKNLPGQSMIFIPLVHADLLVGLLSFARSPKNSMDADFVNFLESIAKYVSITVYNLLITQKRKESELKYRSLIESSSEIIFCVDEKGQFKFTNHVFASTFGKSPNDFIGKSIWDVYQKEIAEYRFEAIKKVFQTGENESLEIEVPLSTKTSYYHSIINPIKDDAGKVILALTHSTDITERKLAEKALLESEKRFRHISSTISDIAYSCTYSKDSGYFIDWMTGATERITGYTIDEIKMLRCWGRLVIKDDISIFEKHVSGLTPGSSATCELRLNHKNGDIIWIAAYTECIKEKEESEKVVLFGALVDITKRKQAEEALQKSREEFQGYFEMGSIGMCVTSPEKGWIATNDRLCQMLGYTKNELSGFTWTELTHPDDLDLDMEFFNQVIEGKIDRYEIDKRFINKNGAIIYTTLSVTCQRNPDGSVQYFLASLLDITDRKRAEDALRESEEKFRSITENLSEAVYITDSNGIITYMSPSSFSVFNYRVEEMIGHLFTEFLDQKEINRVVPIFQNSILTEKPSKNLIITAKRKDNSTFFAEINSSIIMKDGKVQGTRGLIRDITERKNAEAEHLRLQNLESLGVLAGGIAHDFNNILSTILGRASMAAEVTPEGEIKEDLIAIERAALRAVGLTNQLLTFAKGGKPDKNILNLQRLIQDTTKFSLSGSNIETEFDFRDSLKIEADYGQISQVIQNLVINAKQAMPNGGIIKISTEDYLDFREQQFVKIIVEDHGMGIQKEYIDKIFDPYFTSKQTGSGLGLSVCHSIINRHDGKIKVNSEIGIGTTFTILLPATDKNTFSEEKKVNMVSNKLNILIMDDDEEVRNLLSSMLIKSGHDVTNSKEGRETIKIYKEAKEQNKSFDLVFLDLTIKGGLGGIETVKILRNYDPGIKVIVSSGYADSSITNYIEDGFDGMLKKPYTKNELIEVIFAVMNKQSKYTPGYEIKVMM